MNHTTTPAQREAMIALLELSRKYLTHPDVTALPFVLSPTTVAARITKLLDTVEKQGREEKILALWQMAQRGNWTYEQYCDALATTTRRP